MSRFDDLLPQTSPIHEGKDCWFEDPEFADGFPHVYALLAATRRADKFRLPSTITIFVDNGRLKACVSDRSASQSLFMTIDTSEEFWFQLNAYIAGNPKEWHGPGNKRGK